MDDVVLTTTLLTKTWYPLTPTLSVDALQVRLIWFAEIVAALRPVGTEGACVSAACAAKGKAMLTISANAPARIPAAACLTVANIETGMRVLLSFASAVAFLTPGRTGEAVFGANKATKRCIGDPFNKSSEASLCNGCATTKIMFIYISLNRKM